MGLCGINCAWNKLVNTFDKAGSLIADCIGSNTCTKMVGQGLFLVGAVTGDPLVMAIGVGVMAGVDAPSCAGGSAMGCVNLGLDAVAFTAAAPGLSGALGRGLTSLVTDESGSLTLGTGAGGDITASDDAITHIAYRHGGAWPGAPKSVFTREALYELDGLLSGGNRATFVATGRNFGATIDAGRTIGTDVTTGQPTSLYSIIVDSARRVITAHPGSFAP